MIRTGQRLQTDHRRGHPMAFIAYTLPIVPGQSERAGNFRAELNPDHEAHYEELNRRAKLAI